MRLIILSALVGTVTIAACGQCTDEAGCENVVAPAAQVASLSLSSYSLTLEPQDNAMISATPHDRNGRALMRPVNWSSGNTSVASLHGDGGTSITVTGVAPGTTVLTARSEGITAQVAITVAQVVASVQVTPASPTVAVGATVQLTATMRDKRGVAMPNRPVTWTSSSPAQASVSSNGLVTGASAGAATVQATSEGVNGTATVTVQGTGGPPSGELVLLEFEGNLIDSRGNASLIPIGQVAFTSTGANGQALSLNGTGLGYGPSNNLLDNYQAGTVSVWVRPAGTITEETIFGYSTLSSNNSLFSISVYNGRPMVHLKFGAEGLTPQVTSQATIPPNQWSHIVAVADGVTRVKIYVNGSEVATTFTSFNSGANGSEWFADLFQVGAHNHFITVGALRREQSPDGADRFSGAIDQLRIYSTPLTSAQIMALYNSRQ